MNTLWGPYKLSGATSLRIKERMAARQQDTDLDQGSGKRMHLSVLPTIAEHAGTDLLSKSLTQELKAAEWKTPARPASPDSILERAESDSPSSSATSDKSEDLEVEQQDATEEMEELDLVSPTSPLPGFEAPSAKAQGQRSIRSSFRMKHLPLPNCSGQRCFSMMQSPCDLMSTVASQDCLTGSVSRRRPSWSVQPLGLS